MTRIGGAISGWYESSAIHKIFRYNVKGGNSFDNLKVDKLQRIVETVRVGQAYVGLMKSVERLDRLVARALGGKPYGVVLAYKGEDWKTEDEGFRLDKKKRLHVNLNGWPWMLDVEENFRQEEGEEGKKKSAKVAYALLERLIHQRTHQAMGDSKKEIYRHGDAIRGWPKHSLDFFEKKAELRRGVVDYLLENKVDLSAYVGRYLPVVEEDDHLGITKTELSELVYTKRKRLVDEAVKYAVKKEERREERKEAKI